MLSSVGLVTVVKCSPLSVLEVPEISLCRKTLPREHSERAMRRRIRVILVLKWWDLVVTGISEGIWGSLLRGLGVLSLRFGGSVVMHLVRALMGGFCLVWCVSVVSWSLGVSEVACEDDSGECCA